MPRMSRSRSPNWFQLPAVPFLTIMLGLISLMALACMVLSVKGREQERTTALVTLTDIPPNFVPVHLRCQASQIQWRDDQGAWQSLDLGSRRLPVRSSLDDLRRLQAFLEAKAEANRQLSFSGRQHTIILWVEPEGILAALEVQALIEGLGLPLRLGQLPIMSNERVLDNPR